MNRHSYRGLLVLGALTAIALVATFSIGGTARADTVPTSGVISVSGTGPVIECKWELPDMDSTPGNGIQYTKAPGHLHDDDMAIVPHGDPLATGIPVPCHGPGDTPATKPTQANGVHNMIQVAPNFENLPEQRQIQNWMAVDDPGTVSDVFWIVWEPCTLLTNPLCGLSPAPATNLVKKLQVHGTRLGATQAQPCTSLAGTSTTDGSMIEAAIHTGQVTADSFTDTNKGMIALCNQNVKGLYSAEWPLSKDQPCGEYRIDATAVSIGGATTTLTNYIDILCTFQLKIDFGGQTTPTPCAGGITFPALVPGGSSTVGGDLLFAPPCDTKPTVKNVGNSGMGLKLSYSDLVGLTFQKHIYQFDACYGRAPDATLKCFNPIINQPAQTTPTSPEIDLEVDFGTLPAQVLCANEVGKLDPSVHPQAGLPADTYRGTATLTGYAVPGECYGSKHVGG